MVEPVSCSAMVRMVDITPQSYQIACHYMIRLSDRDFKDPMAVSRYTTLAGLLPEAFQARLQPIGARVRGNHTKGYAT